MIKSKNLIPKVNKSSWVKLNVGGKEYLTTKHTLLSTPSIFRQFLVDEPTESVPMWTYRYWIRKYRAYKSPPKLKLDLRAYYHIRRKDDGYFYLDRDPECFMVILNFMRHGKLIYNRDTSITGIMEEASYFQMEELIEVIEDISGIKRADLPKATPLYMPSRTTEQEREIIFARQANVENLDVGMVVPPAPETAKEGEILLWENEDDPLPSEEKAENEEKTATDQSTLDASSQETDQAASSEKETDSNEDTTDAESKKKEEEKRRNEQTIDDFAWWRK